MNTTVWTQVARADTRRIIRDPFMLMITFYLPVMAFVLRWAIPKITTAVQKQVNLETYYPLICVTLVLVLPFIIGVVLGMQMLSEKDERSLNAIIVTPFSFRAYFIFRATLYGLFGAFLLVLTHYIIGLQPHIPLTLLLPTALVFGLNAPVSALILAGFARNQVEGFAVMKGSGFLFTVPGLSFFLPQPWDFFMGIFPFYWPIKAYFLSAAQGSMTLFWMCLFVGVITQLAMIAFLYKRFTRHLFQS